MNVRLVLLYIELFVLFIEVIVSLIGYYKKKSMMNICLLLSGIIWGLVIAIITSRICECI